MLPCTQCDCDVVHVFEAFWQQSPVAKRLLKGRSCGELVVDYSLLCSSMEEFVSDVGEMLQREPSRVLLQLGVAADLTEPSSSNSPTVLRVERVLPLTPLSRLRASKIDTLVSVRGTVTRVGAIRPLVLSASFKCAKCSHEETRNFVDGKYDAPTFCGSGGECKGRSFELQRESATTVDLQELKVQQRDDDDVGRVPRSIDVELLGQTLVGTCVPGDVVVVAGIVRSVNADVAGGRHDKHALNTSTYVLYLDANSLYNETTRTGLAASTTSSGLADAREDAAANAERIRRFKELSRHPQCLSILVDSLCPTIFGQRLPKLGLLLALVSETDENRFSKRIIETTSQDSREEAGEENNVGSDAAGAANDSNSAPTKTRSKRRRIEEENHAVRKTSHVLVVGDPGMGKSQMLKAAAACAPRSVYVCGNTSTTAGLTATVSREKRSGGAALEAGALVLADRGACILDELDKMESSQQSGLLEAMEQQRVSIAKSGIVATLSARTAVLAAANPIGGQYDRSRTLLQNLGKKLSAPLLSRFDLIFLLVDDADTNRDDLLSRHVLGDFKTSTTQKDDNAPLQRASGRVVPRHFLRDYIGYAASTCRPALSTDAARVLRSEYLRMRADSVNGGGPPVTMRQLESLVRLSKSRARLELRRLVTKRDADDVVALLRASLVQAFQQGNMHSSSSSGNALAKGASDAKIVKCLVSALHDTADQNRDPFFTLKQISDVANRACNFDMYSRKPIRDYIEILRDQNYLLYQRHPRENAVFVYKLASSKF